MDLTAIGTVTVLQRIEASTDPFTHRRIREGTLAILLKGKEIKSLYGLRRQILRLGKTGSLRIIPDVDPLHFQEPAFS